MPTSGSDTVAFHNPQDTGVLIKPKRPPSGYFLFAADVRARRNAPGTDESSFNMAAAAKATGEEWRNMNSEDKLVYENQARVLKETYLKQMDAYNEYIKNNPVEEVCVSDGIGNTAPADPTIPVGSVKRIIKLDPSIKVISKSSVYIMTWAAELFLNELATKVGNTTTKRYNKKTIRPDHMYHLISSHPQLEFARAAFPQPTSQPGVSASRSSELNRRSATQSKKRAGESSNNDNAKKVRTIDSYFASNPPIAVEASALTVVEEVDESC